MNTAIHRTQLIYSPPPLQQRDRGFALLTAIILISVALMILAALSNRYFQQQALANQFQIYHTTFDGLEAAIAEARVQFNDGDLSSIGLESWTPVYQDGRIQLPPWDDSDVAPQTLMTNPAVEYVAYIDAWEENGQDSNGDGTVDSAPEEGMFSLHVMARFEGLTRQAEVIFRGMDVNVWRNAIFGGVGQTGALINGNVSIHGSVHLLGENLLEGSPAITAMELSGASMLYNNYQGMPTNLRTRVPALQTVEIDGVQAETLNAKLRVRQGLVSMSGNSRIGEAQVSGADYKGPVDGTYVTDGWTGNSVNDDGDRGVPTRVTSDNGHTELYDLEDMVEFPYLNGDWRENDATPVQNPDTGNWYSHTDYFTQVLVGNKPSDPTHGTYNGDITIDTKNSPSLYWNSNNESFYTGSSADGATPNVTDDYFRYNAATKVLEANGQVHINGDLNIIGANQNSVISYTGRAAFLVDGDLTIAANFLPCNNGDPLNIAQSFPVNNIMGFMATEDINMGVGAQLNIMGAFYAEGSVEIDKQSNIVGSVVANYFDMGGQVPSIYHVPTLYENLPYGMIGNYPIIVLSEVAWREIGID